MTIFSNYEYSKYYFFFIYLKYKLKCLLTKDPSETSSLEYIKIIVIINNQLKCFNYLTHKKNCQHNKERYCLICY